MSDLTTNITIGTAMWLTVFVCAAIAIRNKKQEGDLNPGYMFKICSIVMLCLAPCTALLIYLIKDTNTLYFAGIHLVLALFFFRVSLRQDPQHVPSSMTIREKNALFFIFTLSLIYAMYFALAWGLSLNQALPLLIATIVANIVISIIGSIAINLLHAPISDYEEEVEMFDERDKNVSISSIRNAYWVLFPSLLFVIALTLLEIDTVKIANIAIALLVISELTKYSSQVVYYRFGENHGQN